MGGSLTPTHSEPRRARRAKKKKSGTSQEGLPHDAQVAERPILRDAHTVGWVVGYALLIVAAFAVSRALGACIAVALEYLVGWPDTWWL